MAIARIVGLVGLVLLGGCAGVAKPPAPPIPPDQKFLPVLEQERGKPNGKGLVLFGAVASGMPDCGGAEVGHFADGKFQPIGRLYRREPDFLPAGEYVIWSVACDKTTFNGPHAKFLVKPGEFVDIGVLTFQAMQHDLGDILTGQGSLRRTVIPPSPEFLAKLKDEAPGLIARRVFRPMIIPGPDEVRTSVRRSGGPTFVPVMVRRR